VFAFFRKYLDFFNSHPLSFNLNEISSRVFIQAACDTFLIFTLHYIRGGVLNRILLAFSTTLYRVHHQGSHASYSSAMQMPLTTAKRVFTRIGIYCRKQPIRAIFQTNVFLFDAEILPLFYRPSICDLLFCSCFLSLISSLLQNTPSGYLPHPLSLVLVLSIDSVLDQNYSCFTIYILNITQLLLYNFYLKHIVL
jgi:hypothetical protein